MRPAAEPGLGERLARQPLVLGLGLDGGEDAVGGHAAQQPYAGDAGAGAHLDDRARVEDGGEEAQRGAAAWSDRGAADLLGPRPGGGEDLVLWDVRLGVRPAVLRAGADRDLPGPAGWTALALPG